MSVASQPVRRVEDHRFITGEGRYTDDPAPYGCLHALVLRSPHAYARFQITDLAKGRALPGVRLVLIAPDVAHLGDVPCQAPRPSRTRRVRHRMVSCSLQAS